MRSARAEIDIDPVPCGLPSDRPKGERLEKCMTRRRPSLGRAIFPEALWFVLRRGSFHATLMYKYDRHDMQSAVQEPPGLAYPLRIDGEIDDELVG